jgi:hypothetical protein
MQVPEVQVLEPALVMHDASKDKATYESAYKVLSGTVPINLVSFYDDLGECYDWVITLPVQAISIDFCGVVCLAFLALRTQCLPTPINHRQPHSHHEIGWCPGLSALASKAAKSARSFG